MRFNEKLNLITELDPFQTHWVDLHHSILVYYSIEEDLRRYGNLDFEETWTNIYQHYKHDQELEEVVKQRILSRLIILWHVVVSERLERRKIGL